MARITLAGRIAIVVLVLVLSVVCGNKPGRAATFQEDAAERIGKLADLLERQSQKGSQFETVLSNTALHEVAARIDNARARGIEVAKIAQRVVTDLPLGNSTKDLAIARLKSVQDIKSTSDLLKDYADYLKQLESQVLQSTPEEAVQLLQNAHVPPNVQAIIDPLDAVRTTASIGSDQEANGGTGAKAVGLVPYIVSWADGGATVDYPAVGALIYGNGDKSVVRCTGTLIAPTVVLTAAHCVELNDRNRKTAIVSCVSNFSLPAGRIPDLDPSQVYFQHAGDVFTVDHTESNDNFRFPCSDVALVYLTKPVTNIAPAVINDGKPVATGISGYIVGYGWRSKFLTLISTGLAPPPTYADVVEDTGLKINGITITAPCDAMFSKKSLICWSYRARTNAGAAGASAESAPNAPPPKGTTCEGDSGGPFLVKIDGIYRVAGITSGSTSENCISSDEAFDEEVAAYAPWIKQRLAANHVSLPKPGPIAGNVLNPIINPGRFLIAEPNYIFGPDMKPFDRTFSTDTGAKILHVSVNATLADQTPELSVTPFGVITGCTRENSKITEYCEVPLPAAGTYSLEFKGTSGQAFQVLAVTY